jgi:8-oxo-dGTP pyrophosphatase MutT (NUDIX family)/CYTH domain-containing protein
MATSTSRSFLVSAATTPGRVQQRLPVTKHLLSDEPNRRIFLKQVGNDYFQNIDKLVRGRWIRHSCKLKRDQFQSLQPASLYRGLKFVREVGTSDGMPYRLDRFLGSLEGLNILTRWFVDAEEAFRWTVPKAIGPEITFDTRFRGTWLIKSPPDVATLPVDLKARRPNCVIGVIPYFFTDRKIEVVTVLTRNLAAIIFPKGQPEPNLSAPQVAELEAMEEAGITGTITGHPILIGYKERNPQHWLLYPYEVQHIHSEWKEKGLRFRSLVKLEDALAHPGCARIEPALRYLEAAWKHRVDAR